MKIVIVSTTVILLVAVVFVSLSAQDNTPFPSMTETAQAGGDIAPFELHATDFYRNRATGTPPFMITPTATNTGALSVQSENYTRVEYSPLPRRIQIILRYMEKYVWQ